jgi:hypothetical protein
MIQLAPGAHGAHAANFTKQMNLISAAFSVLWLADKPSIVEDRQGPLPARYRDAYGNAAPAGYAWTM